MHRSVSNTCPLNSQKKGANKHTVFDVRGVTHLQRFVSSVFPRNSHENGDKAHVPGGTVCALATTDVTRNVEIDTTIANADDRMVTSLPVQLQIRDRTALDRTPLSNGGGSLNATSRPPASFARLRLSTIARCLVKTLRIKDDLAKVIERIPERVDTPHRTDDFLGAVPFTNCPCKASSPNRALRASIPHEGNIRRNQTPFHAQLVKQPVNTSHTTAAPTTAQTIPPPCALNDSSDSPSVFAIRREVVVSFRKCASSKFDISVG
jgi:hypothetical protein